MLNSPFIKFGRGRAIQYARDGAEQRELAEAFGGWEVPERWLFARPGLPARARNEPGRANGSGQASQRRRRGAGEIDYLF